MILKSEEPCTSGSCAWSGFSSTGLGRDESAFLVRLEWLGRALYPLEALDDGLDAGAHGLARVAAGEVDAAPLRDAVEDLGRQALFHAVARDDDQPGRLGEEEDEDVTLLHAPLFEHVDGIAVGIAGAVRHQRHELDRVPLESLDVIEALFQSGFRFCSEHASEVAGEPIGKETDFLPTRDRAGQGENQDGDASAIAHGQSSSYI